MCKKITTEVILIYVNYEWAMKCMIIQFEQQIYV